LNKRGSVKRFKGGANALPFFGVAAPPAAACLAGVLDGATCVCRGVAFLAWMGLRAAACGGNTGAHRATAFYATRVLHGLACPLVTMQTCLCIFSATYQNIAWLKLFAAAEPGGRRRSAYGGRGRDSCADMTVADLFWPAFTVLYRQLMEYSPFCSGLVTDGLAE